MKIFYSQYNQIIWTFKLNNYKNYSKFQKIDAQKFRKISMGTKWICWIGKFQIQKKIQMENHYHKQNQMRFQNKKQSEISGINSLSILKQKLIKCLNIQMNKKKMSKFILQNRSKNQFLKKNQAIKKIINHQAAQAQEVLQKVGLEGKKSTSITLTDVTEFLQLFKQIIMSHQIQREYVCVVSKDKKEFYLDLKVANLCNFFSQQFKDPQRKQIQLDNIESNTLEIVLQYLHYKSKYHQITDEKKIPQFTFNPQQGFEVLKASLYLEI